MSPTPRPQCRTEPIRQVCRAPLSPLFLHITADLFNRQHLLHRLRAPVVLPHCFHQNPPDSNKIPTTRPRPYHRSHHRPPVMPPLFLTSTRALIRRCFHPLPTLHNKAPPFFTHRPASASHPRPRFVSDIPSYKDASLDPLDESSHLPLIYEMLERDKEDKWGWVIYRTTYKDDAGWDRFQSYVNTWSHDDLSQPGVPRGLRAADWTFVSDPGPFLTAHRGSSSDTTFASGGRQRGTLKPHGKQKLFLSNWECLS